MERKEQLMRDKKIGFPKHIDSNDDEDSNTFSIQDLSDINVVKMQRYAADGDESGMAFLDEDGSGGGDGGNQREAYKNFLMNEYYEDLKRKKNLNKDG